jgi:hypothetical protein
MAKNDTVQLTHPNGSTVRVSKDSVDRLLGMGFTKPAAKSTKSESK